MFRRTLAGTATRVVPEAFITSVAAFRFMAVENTLENFVFD
jgi:hypothetical protein